MSKVYVLIETIDYEGNENISVYKHKSSAERNAKNLEKIKPFWKTDSTYYVEEHEVIEDE